MRPAPARPAPPAGGLLADLAAVLRSMWQRTPPQSMAMALHAFATLTFTPHELLDAAAEHMALHLPHYTPQAAAVVAWSFGRLGVHPCRGLPEGGPCTPVSAAAAAPALPCWWNAAQHIPHAAGPLIALPRCPTLLRRTARP